MSPSSGKDALPRPAGIPEWVSPLDARSYALKTYIRKLIGQSPQTEEEWNRSRKINGAHKVTDAARLAKDRAFALGERSLEEDIKELGIREAIRTKAKKDDPAGPVTNFKYDEYSVPKALGLRMVKQRPKTELKLQFAKYYKEAGMNPVEANLDPSAFGSSISVDTYDALMAKFPEKKVPVLDLWQYNVNGDVDLAENDLAKEHLKQNNDDYDIVGSNGRFLPAPLQWEDRHGDAEEKLTYVRPLCKEHLDSRGSTMLLSEKFVPAFNQWLNDLVDMTLNDPCLVDYTTEAFRSGKVPTTGLSAPYFPLPDCEYFAPPNHAPNFGELVWEFEEIGPNPDEVDHSLIQQSEMTIASTMDAFLFVIATHKKLKEEEAAEARKQAEEEENRKMDYQFAHEPTKLPDPYKANNINEDPISPDIWMYIRPAKPSDFGQLRDILNHYIKETVYVQETDPVDEQYLAGICAAAEKRGLPVLVACAYKTKPKARRNKMMHGQAANQEKILGFTFAKTWRPETTFKETYEAFIYTSPFDSAQRKGVANNLMDRLLTALDKGYAPHWTTDFAPGDLPLTYFVPGGRSNVHKCRKIVANIYYEDGAGSKELLWKMWFLEGFGFRQSGVFYNVAFRAGGRAGGRDRPYSMASFLYETGDAGVTNQSTWYPGVAKNKAMRFAVGDLL